MKYYIVAFVSFLLVPFVAHADIHITEIAWMGTASSQYSEWFELYNDGSQSVNLAGWKLEQGDGAVIFTMTKSIAADGYLLVERTTASAPDAVPGINDEAGPFGASGFANTGEDLVLKNASGSVVETLSYASGWPAGDATTKDTMQWNGSRWITAPATPDAPATSEGSDSTDDPADDTPVDIDPYAIPKVSPNKPHIEFDIPKTIYPGVPYPYKAEPVFEYQYGVEMGDYRWNFGDGTLYFQQHVEPLIHTYKYPGIYTISFRYTDPIHPDVMLIGSKKVTVAAPTLTLSILDNTAIQLKNAASTSIDISGWTIATPRGSAVVPDMTILAERASIAMPFAILSLVPSQTVSLIDPSGAVVATSAIATNTTTAEVSIADDAPYESPDLTDVLVAHASDNENTTPITNHTKTIVLGVVALFVIGLSILLERVMARMEYQEK